MRPRADGHEQIDKAEQIEDDAPVDSGRGKLHRLALDRPAQAMLEVTRAAPATSTATSGVNRRATSAIPSYHFEPAWLPNEQ